MKKPIKELAGKTVALVAMGNSQLDYHLSLTHSKTYDETWAINAMCAATKPDRVFAMDPMSRFFDTEDAGNMNVNPFGQTGRQPKFTTGSAHFTKMNVILITKIHSEYMQRPYFIP